MARAPRVSQVFAARLVEVRDSRSPKWTQKTLARRILELRGIPQNDAKQVEVVRVMISRTEAGKRSVSIDDAFEFAAALGVSPLALLYPSGELERIALTPRMQLARFVVAAWVAGYVPLRREDVAIYESNRHIRLTFLMEEAQKTVVGHADQLNDEEREAVGAWVAASRNANTESLQNLLDRTGPDDADHVQNFREYVAGAEGEFREIEEALEQGKKAKRAAPARRKK